MTQEMLPSGLINALGAAGIISRGSIARPTYSLSTLRSLRLRSPRKTRYRPAGFALAGRGCPAGLLSRFQSYVIGSSPRAELLLAHW